KARLSLLLVMMKKPNFLILDEPTNHLDIPSREVLEEAFSTYDGTLLCVSHDRYFINKLKTKVLYLKPDGFIEYAGGFSSFSDLEKNEKVKKESPKNDYKAKKELESNKRKLNTKISKLMETIDDVEKEIERLTNELTEHGQDYEKVCELSLQIENLKAQLNQYILEWERASEELERLNSIKI
ncbi:MAG: ABC transporter ATP-binding protein, partial [Clostridiaceae bacterium]|nr:ABC transporter ATP-binding protein [Clostridiaceae bacterium]